MKPLIVGISGKTGAGKTTLAKILSLDLRSTLISWDEFDDVSMEPEDYIYWFHNSQDYSEFKRESLANVLNTLVKGESIVHPVTNQNLMPTNFIIFDAPLGRLHQETGRYIDILIHIEVPLDILLCRRILRDFKDEKNKNDIIEEIQFYLDHSRPLYIDNDLKKGADLVIDGMLLPQQESQIVMNYMAKEKENSR